MTLRVSTIESVRAAPQSSPRWCRLPASLAAALVLFVTPARRPGAGHARHRSALQQGAPRHGARDAAPRRGGASRQGVRLAGGGGLRGLGAGRLAGTTSARRLRRGDPPAGRRAIAPTPEGQRRRPALRRRRLHQGGSRRAHGPGSGGPRGSRGSRCRHRDRRSEIPGRSGPGGAHPHGRRWPWLPAARRPAAMDSGTPARVMARSGGVDQVQVEVWVPDSAVQHRRQRSAAAGSARPRSGPTRALRRPDGGMAGPVHRVQKADELRPDMPLGQPYLLTRGPLPEPGFVYVIVPSQQVGRVRGVPRAQGAHGAGHDPFGHAPSICRRRSSSCCRWWRTERMRTEGGAVP